MIKLLLTIIDNANDEMITIEITADKPPKKTRLAKKMFPSCSGKNKVKYSEFTASPSLNFPPHAMNMTNTLNKSRYNGNSQMAVLICFSRLFSNTET